MKKSIVLSAIIVFVLAVGAAFAESSAATNKDTSGRLYNGITFFDTGKEPICTAPQESGAGGPAIQEMDKEVSNGITVFEARPAGSGAKGACAGGTAAKEQDKKPYNGITVF